MFRPIVFVLFAVTLGTGCAPGDEKSDEKPVAKLPGDEKPAAKLLADLKGTWTFESQTMTGKPVPAADLKALTLTLDGDKFTVKDGETVLQTGTMTLDPEKKTIDAVVADGMGKGVKMLGLFKLDGDTFTVCFDMAGKTRPTEFQSPAVGEVFVNVHKRLKK